MNRLLIALAAVALAGACGGGSSTHSATPSATESPIAASTTASMPATLSPSPTATPTASAILGVPIRHWTVNAPERPPAGSSWLLMNGCTNCGGGIDSLDRITVGSDTVLHEQVFVSSESEYIFGVTAAPDGKEIWLNTCSRGYCGYENKPSADAQSTLRHSLDGGRSWEVVRRFDGPSRMVGGPGNWWLDLSWFGDGSWTWKFERFPTGERVEKGPAGARYPVVDARAGIIWVTDLPSRILRSDGTDFVPPATLDAIRSAANPLDLIAFAGTVPGGDVIVRWMAGTSTYRGQLDNGTLIDVIETGPDWPSAAVSVWTTEDSGYGNGHLWPGDIPGSVPSATRDAIPYSMPAFVDYGTGSITPITLLGPAFDRAYFGRSNSVLAVSLATNR